MPSVQAFDEVVPKDPVPKPTYEGEPIQREEPELEVKTSRMPDDMPEVAPAPKLRASPPVEQTSVKESEIDIEASAPTQPDDQNVEPPEDTPTDLEDVTITEPTTQPEDDHELAPMEDNHDPSDGPNNEAPLEDTDLDPGHEPSLSVEPDITTDWVWADVDPDSPKEPEEDLVAPVEPAQPKDEPILPVAAVDEDEHRIPNKDQIDLRSFFEAPKEQKKQKRGERKKYSRKERKRKKNRSMARTPDAIQDQRVFLFRKKKYKEVDDFIAYLNDHYLDIDDVARDVLADEWFFGWLGKRSGMFSQSLAKFKEIQKRIGEKERTS